MSDPFAVPWTVQPARLLCPRTLPGKDTGAGCRFLLPCWLSILNTGMCTCQLGGASGEEPACNSGDIGSIPGLERSSEEGNGNPLQYSCLENPMDRGAWKTTVHRVPQSRIRLKQRSMHTHRHMSIPNSQSGLRTILTKVPIPPCLQEVCGLLLTLCFLLFKVRQ